MNLTPSDWAAWIQAGGTILAVIAAAWIALWQSRQQHRSAMDLHKAEQRHAQLTHARSLLVLAQNCNKATDHFAKELSSRESIFKIASREKHFDFGELRHLRDATSGIPLYSLPDTLITHAMILAATIRQFEETVAITFQEHREMDAEQFNNVFQTLGEMNESLGLTCGDIENAVKRVVNGA